MWIRREINRHRKRNACHTFASGPIPECLLLQEIGVGKGKEEGVPYRQPTQICSHLNSPCSRHSTSRQNRHVRKNAVALPHESTLLRGAVNSPHSERRVASLPVGDSSILAGNSAQKRPQSLRLFLIMTSVTASNTNWMLLVSVAHVKCV